MPVVDVAVVLDAPITLAEGQRTSRVQIAKTGKFTDPRYGKFSITAEDFAKWIANFHALNVDNGRAGLPVDVDHSPEKFGKTEAAGWVLSIDTLGADGSTSSPKELWATVEWNSLGQELIRDKRYLYLSPSYLHDYEDEAGKKYGTALVGIGLTNRPFLTMATVSLSRAALFAAEDPAPEPTPAPTVDSRERMALPKVILDSLKLPEDATDEQAAEAIKTLEAAKPEPAKVDDKTLEQRAKEDGKVVLNAADVATLQSDAAAGKAAAEELRVKRFVDAFATALGKGQITPAEEESQRELYDLACKSEAGATVLDALSKRPEHVHMKPKGHGGGGDDEVPTTLAAKHRAEAEGQGGKDAHPIDEEMATLDAKATALLAEGKAKDYGEAIVLASAEMGIDD